MRQELIDEVDVEPERREWKEAESFLIFKSNIEILKLVYEEVSAHSKINRLLI